MFSAEGMQQNAKVNKLCMAFCSYPASEVSWCCVWSHGAVTTTQHTDTGVASGCREPQLTCCSAASLNQLITPGAPQSKACSGKTRFPAAFPRASPNLHLL